MGSSVAPRPRILQSVTWLCPTLSPPQPFAQPPSHVPGLLVRLSAVPEPSASLGFPHILSCFSHASFLLTVPAQLRVKDFCPFKFSSRDRNPQWGMRGGWVGSLPLGVISGKTDGFESQRDNSPLHTFIIAVTGLFYNSLFTCGPPPLGPKFPSWARPFLFISVSFAGNLAPRWGRGWGGG